MHVVAAMSGGVDSAVAAALLRDEGHRVTGVFLRSGTTPGFRAAKGKQGCCGATDGQDAARVADLLGIPFYSLDFAEDFDGLIDGFAAEYAAGRTPNPCIICNRDLKFGRLLKFAEAIGADAVATGHYAAITEMGDRLALQVPADDAKDQTYVLFPLTQAQLQRTRFPLSHLTKSETRRSARSLGLPVHEKPESMEICFVPDGDYRAIVAQRVPEALEPGEYKDAATGQVVGRHGGVGAVTIGQRRGLGVTGVEPRYVTSIDPVTNTVVLGRREDLLRREALVGGWVEGGVELPRDGGELRGVARVRRTHAPAAAVAVVESRVQGRVRVVFDEPVSAIAPGQALVFYDDALRVLGGGWIERE